VLALAGPADAACPALPEAYSSAGDQPRALDAFERCASLAPDGPGRWIDLAGAYARSGRPQDAEAAAAKARALDPSDPRLALHPLDTSDDAKGGTR
jgi:Flp pilus assembly protein TadD